MIPTVIVSRATAIQIYVKEFDCFKSDGKVLLCKFRSKNFQPVSSFQYIRRYGGCCDDENQIGFDSLTQCWADEKISAILSVIAPTVGYHAFQLSKAQ